MYLTLPVFKSYCRYRVFLYEEQQGCNRCCTPSLPPTWFCVALPLSLLVSLWGWSMGAVPLAMVGSPHGWLRFRDKRFLSPCTLCRDWNLHRFPEFVNGDIFSMRYWYHLLVEVHLLNFKVILIAVIHPSEIHRKQYTENSNHCLMFHVFFSTHCCYVHSMKDHAH